MTKNKNLGKIRTFFTRLRTGLRLPSAKLSQQKTETNEKKPKIEFEKPQSIAYKLIGERIGPIMPLFKDLDQNLQRSGLRINFKAYVSLTVFATIVATLVVVGLIPALLFSALDVPLLSALLFGVGASLFTCAFSIIGFYIYPIYQADKHKRELDDELPFSTGYMAILASAGVSVEKIFYSLSNMSVPLAVTSEARNIVRNTNLFGLDMISALEATSNRTPSERLRETLEGFISTIHSGGNLAAFLRQKSKVYMKLKKLSLKKFADNLSILSEIYVTLLLTGPLLLVIMLSVMSMLGGSNLGLLSPDLLLNLLTYLGIPVCAVIFLIILDAASPKW